MSFDQFRTNPGQAVNNFKGRSSTPKAWPSTAVSTWTNGGLFGGGSKSWFMEVGAAADGGNHATFEVHSVATNPVDGKTYHAGRWDQYAGEGFNYDYGPCLGLLKEDGSAGYEWFTMPYYGTTNSGISNRSVSITFQSGSTDVFLAFAAKLAGAQSYPAWARFSDSGSLLNQCNSNSIQSSSHKAAISNSGEVMLGQAASSSGFNQWSFTYWSSASANDAVMNYFTRAYIAYPYSVANFNDGLTHYSNNGTSYAYGQAQSYSNYTAHLVRKNFGSNVTAGYKTISGWSSGPVSAYGNGDNNDGLALAYNTKMGKLNSSFDFAWSKVLTASSTVNIQGAYGPTIDVDGNVYVTGNYGLNTMAYRQAFILKFDSSGTLLWQRHITLEFSGAYQYINGKQVAVSLDGTQIYVTLDALALQFTGTGSTNYPRTVLVSMKADGSELGSYLIDNSGGLGAGFADTYTIDVASITATADTAATSPAGNSWTTLSGQSVAVGTTTGSLTTGTPFSANGNMPITPSVEL